MRGCELPGGHRDSDLGPLEEQPMVLIAVFSLDSRLLFAVNEITLKEKNWDSGVHKQEYDNHSKNKV